MNMIAKAQFTGDFLIPRMVYDDSLVLVNTASKGINNSPSESYLRYKSLGEEYRAVFSKEDNRFVPLTYYRIRITAFIGTPEWQFVGFLERKDGQENKLTSVDGSLLSCPPFFRHNEFVCDCCRNKGNRKYLFIMQNRSSGWMKKIGYECLNSFADSKILSDYKHMEKLFDDLRDIEKTPCRNSKGLYPIRMVLRSSIQLVDKYGYVKDGDSSTKDLVCRLVSRSESESMSLASSLGIRSPYDRSEGDLDRKVDRVVSYYSDIKDAKNDYQRQLNEIFSKYQSVPYSRIGLIASAYRKKS